MAYTHVCLPNCFAQFRHFETVNYKIFMLLSYSEAICLHFRCTWVFNNSFLKTDYHACLYKETVKIAHLKKTCWKRYMQVTIFPWTSEIQNFCQEHLWNSKISIFSGGKTMNRQICVKDFERWHVNKINKCELNFSRW